MKLIVFGRKILRKFFGPVKTGGTLRNKIFILHTIFIEHNQESAKIRVSLE